MSDATWTMTLRRSLLLGCLLAGSARAQPALYREVVRFGGVAEPVTVVVRPPNPGTRPPWRVVYLFHGRDGSADDTVTSLGIDEPGFDPGPVLLVVPDLFAGWGVDGPRGAWERVLAHSLPRWVEERWTVRADRDGRSLVGISMGGYAALRIALSVPFRYRAVAALSPALFADRDELDRFATDPDWLFDGAFGRPFEPERYLAQSPLALAARIEARGAPRVFLASGSEDAFELTEACLALGRTLAARGVQSEVRIEPGEHNDVFWKRALPAALASVGE